MSANAANKKPVLTQARIRNAAKQAAWLLAPPPGGAGFSVRQLGEFMGKSGGWVSYLANGQRRRIAVRPEHLHWLGALYTLQRSRHKIAMDEAVLVADIRTHLAQAIAKADELARRIARRRKVTR